MVVPLRERRTRDLAVMPPNLTLGGHDILPEDVHGAIQLDRLGEVVASAGDLADCLGIRDVKRVLARRDEDEGVLSHQAKWVILFRPNPFGHCVPMQTLLATFLVLAGDCRGLPKRGWNEGLLLTLSKDGAKTSATA